MMKEPRQQSTCNGSFFLWASLLRLEMSSMMPWGKLGALPTSRTVLGFIKRETEGMCTL